VTKRAPTPAELERLLFANRVCKHVKSNAIVLAQGTCVGGTGAGQMSRVDSVQLAVRKAGERARGSVLASDAFFPFPDGILAALEAGATAILQPGGSVRDAEGHRGLRPVGRGDGVHRRAPLPPLSAQGGGHGAVRTRAALVSSPARAQARPHGPAASA
jgi:hypothetical protein